MVRALIDETRRWPRYETVHGELLWSNVTTLRLAIEVSSPSSVRADRFTKRHLYQEVGVPLYWVIDADERSAELWTRVDLFPRAEKDVLVWTPDGATEPFEMPLEDLFRPI